MSEPVCVKNHLSQECGRGSDSSPMSQRDSSFIGFLDGETVSFRLEPRPGVEEPESFFPLAEPSPVLGWVWLLPEKQKSLLQSISYCLSYFRAVRPPKAPLVLYLAVATVKPLPEGFSYSEARQKENWARVRLLGILPGNPVCFIEAGGKLGVAVAAPPSLAPHIATLVLGSCQLVTANERMNRPWLFPDANSVLRSCRLPAPACVR